MYYPKRPKRNPQKVNIGAWVTLFWQDFLPFIGKTGGRILTASFKSIFVTAISFHSQGFWGPVLIASAHKRICVAHIPH